MAKEGNANWGGLSLDECLRLEQDLCRSANRPTEYGLRRDRDGNPETPCKDHNAMMLRVLGVAFNFAKQRGLRQQHLAKALGVSTNKIGEFLRGQLTGAFNGRQALERGLQRIFLGNSEPDPRKDEVVRRVRNYFLRDGDGSYGVPRFFVPERRYIGSPCSLIELGYEVGRVIRWIQTEKGTGSLVVAGMSGPPDRRGRMKTLFPCWHHPILEDVFSEAAGEARITTLILYPKEDTSVEGEMRALLGRSYKVLPDQVRFTPLAPGETRLLSPFVQYLYLEPSLNGVAQPAESVLFMVRTGTTENFPLSWAADENERECFISWFDSARNNPSDKVAIPGPTLGPPENEAGEAETLKRETERAILEQKRKAEEPPAAASSK